MQRLLSQLFIDVSEKKKPIGPIFKCQSAQGL